MKSNYDRHPTMVIPGAARACNVGWGAIGARLWAAVAARGTPRTVMVVECYAGVDERSALAELVRALGPSLTVAAADALLAPAKIERLVEPYLGEGDPIFGYLSGLRLPQFFETEKCREIQCRIRAAQGLVLVAGCGALHVAGEADILVYADLARREAQLRFRRGEVDNLGAVGRLASATQRYKRAFFVDWRVCDRWKRPLIRRWDFLLDTHDSARPKMAEGEAMRRALRHAVTRPFRVVPFFDSAPWGGQWMKKVCGLDPAPPNYGWCFDCVPEENSLLLDFSGTVMEIPSLDLVFDQPRALLGEAVHARFGDEFPIRFDLLDTVLGGNLSVQVHPLTEYIQRHFGMHYTQDESYYLIASDGGCVYLGLKEECEPAEMLRELRAAQSGGATFEPDRYLNRLSASAHDHFLIPAGTVHCSGRNCLVLEISATPYIFTFKLWDWNRLGLDGAPRPIHLEHGAANIDWDRRTAVVAAELVNRVEPIASGEGWREERTGLHRREFIETRRHWFSAPVPHHTAGGVNVLNLVAGSEAVIESPDGGFAPFPLHFAETVIVPAAVGSFVVRPLGGGPHATMKAFVRT